MKNPRTYLILLVFFGLTSCDEVEELTEVDFNATLSEEVNVTLSEEQPDINGSLVINLDENIDIAQYSGKIISIEITDAYYVLKNYVGLEEATGNLTATAASETFGPFEHAFFTDAQSGKTFTLNDISKLKAVSNALKANKQLNIQFSGEQIPAQDASFNVEFTLKLKVTAQPL
jgi:hypothetical protein